MLIFHILENVIFGAAGLIVVVWLYGYFQDLYYFIKFKIAERTRFFDFDPTFFLENFSDNCKVTFLTEQYDKVRFASYDTNRFVIMLENTKEPTKSKMIFTPFLYAAFKDYYRTWSTHIIIDDKFYMFRFGDSFRIDATDELQQEVYGDDGR